MPMKVTIPAPTASSDSITRPLDTVNPMSMFGTASPRATAASA